MGSEMQMLPLSQKGVFADFVDFVQQINSRD